MGPAGVPVPGALRARFTSVTTATVVTAAGRQLAGTYPAVRAAFLEDAADVRGEVVYRLVAAGHAVAFAGGSEVVVEVAAAAGEAGEDAVRKIVTDATDAVIRAGICRPAVETVRRW